MTSMADKMVVLDRTMRTAPVIPVLVVADWKQAVPLARALVAGGLRVLEFTLRTDAALDAVRAVAAEVPDAIVGTGTVRSPDQLVASAEAGAVFAVSPGGSPRLLDAAADHPLWGSVRELTVSGAMDGRVVPSIAWLARHPGWRWLERVNLNAPAHFHALAAFPEFRVQELHLGFFWASDGERLGRPEMFPRLRVLHLDTVPFFADTAEYDMAPLFARSLERFETPLHPATFARWVQRLEGCAFARVRFADRDWQLEADPANWAWVARPVRKSARRSAVHGWMRRLEPRQAHLDARGVNEQWLWHGTSNTNPWVICSGLDGVDFRVVRTWKSMFVRCIARIVNLGHVPYSSSRLVFLGDVAACFVAVLSFFWYSPTLGTTDVARTLLKVPRTATARTPTLCDVTRASRLDSCCWCACYAERVTTMAPWVPMRRQEP